MQEDGYILEVYRENNTSNPTPAFVTVTKVRVAMWGRKSFLPSCPRFSVTYETMVLTNMPWSASKTYMAPSTGKCSWTTWWRTTATRPPPPKTYKVAENRILDKEDNVGKNLA